MNITDKEKSQLRKKISISVSQYIQRKRYMKYGLGLAAASMVVFFSISIFLNESKVESSIDTYVKTLNGGTVPDQVRLILSDNQHLEITDPNSNISYSNTGEQVNIGNTKSVNQKTLNDQKIVFNTLIVPYGKRSSIELADGSKVWLNSGSKLVFPAAFTQEKREVYIEGEGIFEVAHDKNHPFIVKSGGQSIEVLGTVFNIRNYHDDDAISTVLKTGSIKISYPNNSSENVNESITIVPNTLAIYDRNGREFKTHKVEVEKYFSWRDGIFIFKNDSLQSIMKKISRYYNIQIVINNKVLANATFSGYLDVKDSIDKVIETIQETTKFDYTITENKIIIN